MMNGWRFYFDLEIDESNIDILLKDEDEQEMCADEDFKFSYE